MNRYYDYEDEPAVPQHCGNPDDHDLHYTPLGGRRKTVCTGNISAKRTKVTHGT